MKVGPAPFSVEVARALLDYDPQTGALVWRSRDPSMFEGAFAERQCATWNSRFAGKRAGSLGLNNRWSLGFNKRRVSATRVIWLLVTGTWPEKEVDHKNTDSSDDSWVNLRLATKSQNSSNQGAKHGGVGLKGVYARKRGRFVAQIKVKGVHIHLGVFNCPAAAHFAYVIASAKYHGEFGRAA